MNAFYSSYQHDEIYTQKHKIMLSLCTYVKKNTYVSQYHTGWWLGNKRSQGFSKYDMSHKGRVYFNSLVPDCSNFIVNALELPQSCTKPSIFFFLGHPIRFIRAGGAECSREPLL